VALPQNDADDQRPENLLQMVGRDPFLAATRLMQIVGE
jgi:hypothetical protein